MTEEFKSGKYDHELTPIQKELVGLLFDTEVTAPVGKRINQNGIWVITKAERKVRIVDVSPQEGEFTLRQHQDKPDASLSPIYISLRNLPNDVLDRIGFIMANLPLKELPDFCTGIPQAGNTLAKAYSKHSKVPYIDVLAKKEIEKARIVVPGEKDGKGKKLLLIDDVVSEGNEALEAEKAAKQMNFEVIGIMVLINRLQGARLENLYSALTIDTVLRYGARTGRISKEKYQKALDYFGLK